MDIPEKTTKDSGNSGFVLDAIAQTAQELAVEVATELGGELSDETGQQRGHDASNFDLAR